MEFPKPWIDRIKGQLGEEATALIQALQTEAVTSIRVNPKKFREPIYQEKVPWHPGGYYLNERPVFTLDPLFHAGAYYVQEASSMFLREVLLQSVDIHAELNVLDLCAAPGGKSTLLLSELSPTSLLVANEMVPTRVPSLRHNLIKWGFPNYIVSHHHPDDFSPLQGLFDVVVIDAPCSGEGLFRKDPKAIQEWSSEHARQCALRQNNILDAAYPLMKPGGILIYSTCTFNPEENEDNLVRWLQQYPLEALNINVPESWGILKGHYGYHFYPHRLKGEGFFIASLRKAESAPPHRFKSKPARSLTKLNKEKEKVLKDWVDERYALRYFQKGNNQIVGIPEYLLDRVNIVLNALVKRSVGVNLGIFKSGELVPAHDLSQCLALNGNVSRVELSLDEALYYLKKEEFDLPKVPRKGWHLATYQGLGLGWIKTMPNRCNNYFPNEYRIKMALPK